MKDSEPRVTPPIPPRRLKRKNKSLVGRTDGVVKTETISGIRLEPRPRLPPPPPPQRNLPRRGVCPQLLPPLDIAETNSPGSYSAENCHSHSITGDKLLVSEFEEVRPTLSTFGTPLCLSEVRGSGKKSVTDEPPRRKREKVKVSRPDDYPPLFFTLQDFQDVMSEADRSYNRTLKNMTSFEPTPKPRASKIPVVDLPRTPENEKVLFRVTTTNVPFEKSTSEWGDVRNYPNHFIFEDYVDRRQIPVQRRSIPSTTKLVLFGDDTFDQDDEEKSISTSHTASRVRFLIDSPITDENVEKISELDSLQNVDSLPLDCLPSQSLMTKGKPIRNKDEDEFGDVPFDSLLNPANDSPSFLSLDYSEDSTSSRTDFQTILVTATIEPVPLIKEVEKLTENCQVRDADIKSPGEKDIDPLFEEEVISRDKDAYEELKNPRPEMQDLEFAVKCKTEKNEALELSDEGDKAVASIYRRDVKRKISVDESLLNFMGVEDNVDDSPPENIRRNSFLMNMLRGDETLGERVVCKVVATHPKTPIHESRASEGRDGGGSSTAVEAKTKLLGELSSNFSAIKLKPVNNVAEVKEKQSAGDLRVDSMNIGKGEEILEKVENRDDDNDDDHADREVEMDKKYILNRNLDSDLDSNVVKCKVREEPIEESRRISRNEPQYRSNVCSQKTDDIIDKKKYVMNINSVCEESKIEGGERKEEKKKNEEKTIEDEESYDNNDDNYGNNHNGLKIKENNNTKVVEVGSGSSVDKCAIVLRCNNNNDNNAMTPVDVSYDQSPNNVSIIPGSVRSFVKFYEIQGETSGGILNSNETAAVPKIKVEATGNPTVHYQEIITSKNIISHSNCMEIENDIKYTIVARKPAVKKQHNPVPAHQNQIVNLREDKSDKSNRPVSAETESPEFCSMPIEIYKTDTKKDVSCHTGSTTIRSASIYLNEQKETETERKREPRPRSFASKKIDATVTPNREKEASVFDRGTQDGSTTSGITKDFVRSGTTNHLVPKSSISTINEQYYTFYCTV